MSPLISPDLGSLLIALLQFYLAYLTLPAIRNKQAQVPRAGSVPTAISLWVMGIVFLAMGPLWLAAAGSGVCALGWTFIAALRPVQRIHDRHAGHLACHPTYCDLPLQRSRRA